LEELLKRFVLQLGEKGRRITQVIANPSLGRTYLRLRRDHLGFHEYEAWRLGWLEQLGIRTIFDVGANVGQFFLLMKHLFPDARVYCFEPLAGPFRELKERVDRYPGSRAFNCALGASAKNIVFYENRFSAASSPLPLTAQTKRFIANVGADPEAFRETEIEVECLTLDDVCARSGVEILPETLIKLDVQGYEDQVILGGEQVFSKAKVVVAEVSFFEANEGQMLFDGIYTLLRERGFGFYGFIDEQRSPIDDTVMQADAIFVRP
jgi:FkbM family methyltransferase